MQVWVVGATITTHLAIIRKLLACGQRIAHIEISSTTVVIENMGQLHFKPRITWNSMNTHRIGRLLIPCHLSANRSIHLPAWHRYVDVVDITCCQCAGNNIYSIVAHRTFTIKIA